MDIWGVGTATTGVIQYGNGSAVVDGVTFIGNFPSTGTLDELMLTADTANNGVFVTVTSGTPSDSTPNVVANTIRATARNQAATDIPAALNDPQAVRVTYTHLGQALPTVPAGHHGGVTFVGPLSGAVIVPAGYDMIESDSSSLAITGRAANQLFVGRIGGQDFSFGGPSGVAYAAGGNNTIATPATGGTGYTIVTGIAADRALSLSSATAPPIGLDSVGGNTIDALSGNDSIAAGLGANLIFLGSGTDLVGSDGSDTIVATTGVATVTAGSNAALVFGGSGLLTFLNGSGASTVVGGVGSITASGGTGSLFAWGGSGDGVIVGGFAGGNVLGTGSGATTLLGGGSSDLLVATGPSNDVLAAGPVAETLTGGNSTGNNRLFGNSGADQLIAGFGADTLVAGSGNATLFGGPGADQLFGGSGVTVLQAGSGNNTLVGNSGAATFYTGPGNDTVAAGTGADLLVFTNGFAGGHDVVLNFGSSDSLHLQNYGSGAVAAAVAGQLHTPAGTTITSPMARRYCSSASRT